MKNLISTAIVLFVSLSFAYSQQIQRDKVLVEIGTGTWCQYCPGAAMGADELVENGHDVAIIENHNGDSYTNTASNARNSYYNISGYPTAMFDGGSAYVGGSNNTSLYPQYLQRYNQKINIPTSFSIDVEGTTAGFAYFDIDITVEMVDPYTGSDIRLHAVVTESHIQENWQGQTHLNFVQRMMIPDHNGTQLDFSSGNTIVQNLTFEIDPDWVSDNCELVIFLQEHGTKEVLNASKRDLMDFENVNDYDASLSNISNVPEKTCTGSFSPSFVLRNNGNEDLTSLSIFYNVNDGVIATYDWTGNLAFLEQETIDLPSIAFSPEEDNLLLIYANNPNGNPDQYPASDTISHVIPEADYTSSVVTLYLRCDNFPEETTWELLDNDGTVVYEGGPYANPNHTVIEEFVLDDLSCYQFYVYDEGGNGLNSPGMFRLFYDNDNIIIDGMNNFGGVKGTDFSTDNNTGIGDDLATAELMVYPNPFSSKLNIALDIKSSSHVIVNVYNMLNELVYHNDEGIKSAGENIIIVDGNKLVSGIYILQVEVNNDVITRKVTVTH